MTQIDRRQFVLGNGALILTSAVTGCLNGNDVLNDDSNDAPPEGIPAEVHDYMVRRRANGYDETVENLTGEDEITIDVGDPRGGSNYMFQPAVPEIDEGTTVVWEWIDNVSHSVTHVDEEFDSGIRRDYTFEYTFDETGNYLYYCIPHRTIGHIGALIVV